VPLLAQGRRLRGDAHVHARAVQCHARRTPSRVVVDPADLHRPEELVLEDLFQALQHRAIAARQFRISRRQHHPHPALTLDRLRHGYLPCFPTRTPTRTPTPTRMAFEYEYE